MERDGIAGFEMLVLVLGGAAAALLGIVWGGAALALLASGHPQGVSASEAGAAAAKLPSHLSDPAAAWEPPNSETLPGPVLYWLCTAFVGATLIVALVLLVKWLARSRVGTSSRRP